MPRVSLQLANAQHNCRACRRPEKLESRDDLTLSNLIKNGQPCILVLGNPKEPFTTHEFEVRSRLHDPGSFNRRTDCLAC